MTDESAANPPVPSPSFEEAAVIRRCQDGDTAAFAELVERYQDRLYNLMRRMANSSADAEELSQDAFLKAFEKIDQFRGGSRFYTWLFRIAANLAISRRRRGRSVRFVSLSGDRPDESGQSFADTVTADLARQRHVAPDAAAIAQEKSQRIDEAIAQLDNEFRAVVVLRDIEELDYSEIAEILELPVGTVKSRLHRGRNVLKEKLADLIER